MKEDASGRRQRAVMATDAEWERIGRAAAESGMDLSRFVIHRALDWDPLPAEVLRRAVREMLVLARLEERRLRGAGAGKIWEDACDAVDEWIDREGHAGGADRSRRGEPLEGGGAGRGGRAVTEAAEERPGRRQRSLHCKPAEQAMNPGARGGGEQDRVALCDGACARRRSGPSSPGAVGRGTG